MRSFDTNIAVHAANTSSPLHQQALAFVAGLGAERDVAVCELMLVELYLKLRNAKIFEKPLSAAEASAVCQTYRNNGTWMVIESAPVMDDVWKLARGNGRRAAPHATRGAGRSSAAASAAPASASLGV